MTLTAIEQQRRELEERQKRASAEQEAVSKLLELALPIEGVGFSVVPAVIDGDLYSFRWLWQVLDYAKKHRLEILPSADINRVASSVKPEEPSKEFIWYAREDTRLSKQDVLNAYATLQFGLWGGLSPERRKYWDEHYLRNYKRRITPDEIKKLGDDYKTGRFIRAREILVWTPSPPNLEHPHIRTLEDKEQLQSFLLTNYDLQMEPDQSPVFTNARYTPIDWPKENGRMTPELAQLLGATESFYVDTLPSASVSDGLMHLDWCFSVGASEPQLRNHGITNPYPRGHSWLLGKRV